MKRFAAVLLMAALTLTVFSNCESPALKGAKVYLQKGQTKEAKEQLILAIQAQPASAEAHFLLGQIYYQEGKYEEGNKHFEQSLANSPARQGNIMNQRRNYSTQHHNGGAKYLAAATEEQDPERRKQLYEEAIKEFETALIIMDRPESIDGIASCYSNLGQYDKAKEYYVKVLEDDPKNENALWQLGSISFNYAVNHLDEPNVFDDAIKYFEIYIADYPQEKMKLLQLADAYQEIGQDDKAISFYEDLMKDYPNNADLMTRYGVLLYKMERTDDALEMFKKVYEIDPNNADVVKEISFRMFYKLIEQIQNDKETTKGDWMEVLPYLEKYAELQPQDPDGWEYLSIVYARVDMGEKALEADAKAKELRKIK